MFYTVVRGIGGTLVTLGTAEALYPCGIFPRHGVNPFDNYNVDCHLCGLAGTGYLQCYDDFVSLHSGCAHNRVNFY
ncbi:MAG: hypothetical protein ABSE51_11440 [Terracidiphilus sp.]